MSTFKFSENLFIGKQELDRFLLFMRDQGFVRTLLANSLSFGIVRNKNDYSFDNAKVITGDLDGQVKVRPVLAIDKDGLTIFTGNDTTLSIPDDGNWHWIKVSHEFTSLEKGTVSIDANGNLTGTETEFTKVLRGQPNFPSRIRFPNASLNLNEYEVASVIDDQNAVLQGAFQVESDIKYEIIGTFTPGSFPVEAEKNPFQYDAAKFEVIDEPSLTALTEGKEFYLARCKNNAGTVEIQDRRTKIFRTKASYELNYVPTAENPLVGVEGIHYGTAFSPLNENRMIFAWGFRSDNWTIDTTLNTLTLAGGLGGKYKSTSDFVDGDFNGWRVYTEDGEYSIVKASTKSGSQINLVLDSLNPDRFSDASQELVVVPNAEAIKIHLSTGGANEVPNKVREYPIYEAFKKIPVEVYEDPTAEYNIKYSYRTFKQHSPKWTIPSDTDNGYYNEQSYDVNGQLKDPVDRQKITYTADPSAGFITFNLSPDNMRRRIDELDTGVVFGVDYITLENATPLVKLDPSINSRYQRIIAPDPFTLTVDHYIDLNVPNAVEGSEFFLDINSTIDLNGFQLRVVQGYVSPGDIGTEVLDITADLLAAAATDDLWIRLTFDENGNWFHQVIESSDVTKTYVDNQDSTLQSNINSVQNSLTSHENDTGNPHSVTADQTGAYPKATGGNARGTDAVDFQYNRSQASQVASGPRAFIAGGQNNVASGDNAHAEGNGADAVGNDSHAEGQNTQANGVASHSEGQDTEARGLASHAQGGHAYSLGAYNHAQGRGAVSSAYGEVFVSGATGTTITFDSGVGDISAEFAAGNILLLVGNAEGAITVSLREIASVNYDGTNTTIELVTAMPTAYENTSSSYRSLMNLDNVIASPGAHVEGVGNVAWGQGAHAEGNGTLASALGAHAEGGLYTKATGKFSHAEGEGSRANGRSSHAEGRFCIALGDRSHAEGASTDANGAASHAEGDSTVASGPSSHAEGQLTTASGDDSHAEGEFSTAAGHVSHAQGYDTRADGVGASAAGGETLADGFRQFVVGNRNVAQGSASTQVATDYIFIVGTESASNARNTGMAVDWNGDAFCDGAFTGGGADYAEMFEWEDGNPDEEDRAGYFVELDGNKIKKATEGTESHDLLGVISADPTVLGDSAHLGWKDKYLKDDFGRYVTEEVPNYKVVTKSRFDEETMTELEDVPDYMPYKDDEEIVLDEVIGTLEIKQLNPDYDPEREYVPRAQRPEWGAVGMMGKLIVRDTGKAEVGDWIRPNDDGIAHKTTGNSNIKFRVLKRINDNVIQILLK